MQANDGPREQLLYAPQHGGYALLTAVLEAVVMDRKLRTSIIPDDLMRCTSKEWRAIQRKNVPIALRVFEPAPVVRDKLEMFLNDGFVVSEVNLSNPNLYEYDGAGVIGDEGLRMLEPVLLRCPLQKLNLSGVKISNRGVSTLASVMVWRSLLTHLVLDYNKIGDFGATTLANALGHCQSLQTLSVNGIQMQPNGFSAICSGLARCQVAGHESVFTHLSVANNYIVREMDTDVNDPGDEYEEPFYSAFVQLTEDCYNLQFLDISNNWIFYLRQVARALRNARKLTSLKLACNNLNFEDDSAVEAFMQALETHPSLTELSMPVVEMNSRSYERLAQALSRCTTLAILDLEDSNMSDDAVGAMSEALTQSPHLTDLNLKYNELTINGVNALKQAWLHGDTGLHLEFQRFVSSDSDDMTPYQSPPYTPDLSP